MSSGYQGQGGPRVRRGSPYDTPELVELLAKLESERGAPSPTDVEPGSIILPRRLVDRYSGFLDRIIEDHETGRSRIVPATAKDPSASEYGIATRESTITWGQTQDLTFNHNVVGQPEPSFPIVSTQVLHVYRPRPVTHTILVAIALGNNWSGENQTTVTITYIVGVGQGKLAIPKVFVLTIANLVNASNTVPIIDVNQWPFQSLQVNVSYTLSPGVNGQHPFTIGAFTAPLVQ